MKFSKIMGKQAVVVAIAAAAALIAGSASAAAPVDSAKLTGYNDTKGCVRFYVTPSHPRDVKAGANFSFGTVSADHTFQASVFSGACAGKARKTVSYKTVADGSNNWHVR